MFRRILLCLASAGLPVALAGVAGAGNLHTGDAETKPFSNAVVTYESGVRVIRPLAEHRDPSAPATAAQRKATADESPDAIRDYIGGKSYHGAAFYRAPLPETPSSDATPP